MDFEFDKEIDSLLRQMAKGESASTAAENVHIDADEISMFAENALPEKARPRVVKHLADCGRCRTILSNVIVLNSEAEEENAASVSSADEVQAATAVVSAAEIPWYQKIFATKNLAFGMGALALIFAVGIGFLVVQNSQYSGESEMAQADTNVSNANASTMEEAATADVQDSANANTAMESNTEMAAAANANSTANVGADAANRVADEKETLSDSKIKEAGEVLAERRRENLGRTGSKRDNSADKVASSENTTAEEMNDARIVARTESLKNEDRQPAEKDELKLSPPPPANKPAATSSGATADSSVRAKKTPAKADDDEKESKKKAEGSKSDRKVNGKNFTYKNGVWTDTAYTGQKTKTVKRGTSDYRNLDRGLQSIGNQLYGTVIVVWKSKAYKIQ